MFCLPLPVRPLQTALLHANFNYVVAIRIEGGLRLELWEQEESAA